MGSRLDGKVFRQSNAEHPIQSEIWLAATAVQWGERSDVGSTPVQRSEQRDWSSFESGAHLSHWRVKLGRIKTKDHKASFRIVFDFCQSIACNLAGNQRRTALAARTLFASSCTAIPQLPKGDI